MIELRIGGRAVDISPDTQITLEFKSNLFGDISEITASNSMTINIPKTPTNNNIFGSPAVVGGQSTAPYRKWEAELYVNGVKMVEAAYAVLLSVGSAYEITLYWGVAKALSALKDNDKTLKDIAEVLSIQYGGNNWWTDWEGKVGKDENGNKNANLINAVYECGIPDLRNDLNARAQVALLPSVRVSWVWGQVLRDNDLRLIVPQTLNFRLDTLAIPFTTHKVVEDLNLSESFTKVEYHNTHTFENKERYAVFIGATNTAPVNSYGYFELRRLKMKLMARKKEVDTYAYIAKLPHEVTIDFKAETQIIGLQTEYTIPGVQVIDKEGNLKQKEEFSRANNFNAKFTLNLEEGDQVMCYIQMSKENKVLTASMSVSASEGEMDQAMGGIINTRDNLPEIKQLDFVKDICAMQGLWPTLIGGEVYLVRYADFYNGAQPTLDWSHKLVSSGDSDAPQISYTLGNLAQRNILTYAEDDSVKIDASATLYVDNDNLEQEQDMFELQFAASDDNVIPHYKLKEAKDGEAPEVEEEGVEPRIMEITSSVLDKTASLNFGNLSWSNLVSNNYPYWQRIMRTPSVITEQMWLSEIDIKELDYRKPIYLQKYGARFAVQQVQWSAGEPSSVTLVYLPPMEDIAVALPYNVSPGVAYAININGSVDAVPSLAHLVSGKGEYFAESATIRFDESAGAREQLKFKAWVSPAGRTISTENPYIYDGRNGDLEIIAMTEESFVIG